MSVTIATLGEQALIDRIQRRVGPVPHGVRLGIGDDAAALDLERGTTTVITTDSLVEGVHFRRDWTSPGDIGHKALAVNLSDLAAMGATPRACLLSLVLPATFLVAEFDALLEGFLALARESRVALVGGNLARSPGPVVVDVTAIGSARPRRLLRRDTARAGDMLYVTGAPGAAAAGLAMRAAGVTPESMDDAAAACVARYERPDARWRIGSTVARSGAASAAMDTSDGLADAARKIADASGVGVVIDAEAVPIAEGLRVWATRDGRDPLSIALGGGEDYELAFAVSPRRRSTFRGAVGRYRDLPVTPVGRFVKERGAWLERGGLREPLPAGFAHF